MQIGYVKIPKFLENRNKTDITRVAQFRDNLCNNKFHLRISRYLLDSIFARSAIFAFAPITGVKITKTMLKPSCYFAIPLFTRPAERKRKQWRRKEIEEAKIEGCERPRSSEFAIVRSTVQSPFEKLS